MNSDVNDSQFRKALNKAFPETPPGSSSEFGRIMRAMDEYQNPPAWIRWVGSPVSALSAALLLVVVITSSPRMNWSWMDEAESFTWTASDQDISLGEFFDLSGE